MNSIVSKIFSDGLITGLWAYDHHAALLLYLAIDLAILEMRRYRRLISFTDYSLLAGSPQAPGMSILAPAYNEGATVVDLQSAPVDPLPQPRAHRHQ